jgi:hypothetical protein
MHVTLGIDDEDAVDIVRDIERSFDIIISNSEAAACWTLGDIFDLVLQRFSDSGRGGHTCASAMAFYRLRRAFASIAPTVKLKPSTQLTDVAKMSVKRLFEEIETHTALKLPRKATSPVGWIGAVGIIGGLLATVPVGIIGGGSALLVLGAAVFIALWLLYTPMP